MIKYGLIAAVSEPMKNGDVYITSSRIDRRTKSLKLRLLIKGLETFTTYVPNPTYERNGEPILDVTAKNVDSLLLGNQVYELRLVAERKLSRGISREASSLRLGNGIKIRANL